MSKRKTCWYLAQLPPRKRAWVLARLIAEVLCRLAGWAAVLAALVGLAGALGLVGADVVASAGDALMLIGAMLVCAACVDGFTAIGYVPEGMRLIDADVAERVRIAHALRRDAVWWSSLVSTLSRAVFAFCLALAIKGGGAGLLISAALALMLAFLTWARLDGETKAPDKKGTADA